MASRSPARIYGSVSADIDGWGEVAWNPPDNWAAVLRIGVLVERNSLLRDWLFRTVGGFRPVAPDRGLPANISPEVARDVADLQPLVQSGEVGSFTWASWHELDAIDWDEGPLPGREVKRIEVQGTRADGSPLLIAHPMTSRRATIDGYSGWHLLFDLIRRLAQDYGGDNVRLVVWFRV